MILTSRRYDSEKALVSPLDRNGTDKVVEGAAVQGGFSILRGIHNVVVNRAFASVVKTFPTPSDRPVPRNMAEMVGLLLEFARCAHFRSAMHLDTVLRPL